MDFYISYHFYIAFRFISISYNFSVSIFCHVSGMAPRIGLWVCPPLWSGPKYLNYWMDCHGILYGQSWSPEDEYKCFTYLFLKFFLNKFHNSVFTAFNTPSLTCFLLQLQHNSLQPRLWYFIGLPK